MKKRLDDIVNNTTMFFRKDQKIDGVPVSIYSYSYFNPIEFAAIKDPIKKEMRGLALVGNKIFPSIHRFFNLNENEFAITEKDLPEQVIALEKVDGTLITPVEVNGKLYFKTKASFFLPQALASNNLLSKRQKDFILELMSEGIYPIFEYISPLNRVVLLYPNEELRLIAVRKAENSNFKYLPYDKIIEIAETLNISPANFFEFSKEELLKKQKTEEEVEGWVIYTSKDLVKIKTQWYFENHKYNPQNIREDFIFNCVLNEEIDDVFSMLSGVNPELEEKVREYANKIYNYLSERIKLVEKVYSELDQIGIENFCRKEDNKKYWYLISYYKKKVTPIEVVKDRARKEIKQLSDVKALFGEIIFSAHNYMDLQYNIFGSENSTDIDVIAKLNRDISEFSTEDLHQIANIFAGGLKERLSCSSVDVNLVNIEGGIITKSFKGVKDEINNAVYYTYHLHKQEYPCLIKKPIPRNFMKKLDYISMKVLTYFTKGKDRQIVKKGLKNKDYINTLKYLYENFDGNYLKDIKKHKGMELKNLTKKIVFYTYQLKLLKEEIEVYTKNDLIKYFPEIENAVNRTANKEESIEFIYSALKTLIDLHSNK